MLHIKDLKVEVAQKAILHGISLIIGSGDIHALMGPNGSGKSTFAYSLMGHPAYKTTNGSLLLEGSDLLLLSPDKRARAGVFLSFQHPATLAGVRAESFLLESYRAVKGTLISIADFRVVLQEHMTRLSIDPSFAYREVNEGFSGGEKKKFELLQLALLQPKIAILDEIDSGLDIDALKTVADGIAYVRSQNPSMSFIIITHYRRILQYIVPNHVHIIHKGLVVASGGADLVDRLEQEGYEAYRG